MPRLRYGFATPEVVDPGKEELPQLVRRCACPTNGCDNHGMALPTHGLTDVPGRPIRKTGQKRLTETAGTDDGRRRQRLLHANCRTTAYGTRRK